MKKILLSLLPAVLILSGCGNKNTADPNKVYNAAELKYALQFKALSNFQLDISYFVVTDYGTHDEVEGNNTIYYFKDNLNESYDDYQYNHIVTSKDKYREYCESKSIEYKESDFLAFIEYYEQRGFKKTEVSGLYTLKWERSEIDYTKCMNDYYQEIVYKVNDRDFIKVLEFNNDERDYTKTHMFNTNYIDYSLLTYDEENKCYNMGDKTLGGIIEPIFGDEVRFDNYQVTYAYSSFLNKNLKKIDMYISGQYSNMNRGLSLTIEVKNINGVSYDIPDAKTETCDHEDIYWNDWDGWHYQICDDCDNYILGSEAKCQYDENGVCTVCHNECLEREAILTYDYFGYHHETIYQLFNTKTKACSRINYDLDIGETEAFDYITFTDDPNYYEVYRGSGTGAPLFHKCGTKTFLDVDSETFNYVFPEVYTFETRKIEEEDKRVMVISKTYHENISRWDS